MRVVVALGGNALLQRDEPMTIERQVANVVVACDHLAPIACAHELVIAHGNGPQVGLLALEAAAYRAVPPAPLDVLGAESQGMIGYLVERELRNRLPAERPVATLLTMIDVDPDDPAFGEPSKPIGPWYARAEAEALAAERGWVVREQAEGWRRVVPSPTPTRIVEQPLIIWLLERGAVVICAGGGGIPTVWDRTRRTGVEAVIDKDHASALLARDVGADLLVLATDVPAVSLGYGTPSETPISAAHPDAILAEHEHFGTGSMLPKVQAAAAFAQGSRRSAVIGALADIERMVGGTAGTRIATDVDGIVRGPTLDRPAAAGPDRPHG